MEEGARGGAGCAEGLEGGVDVVVYVLFDGVHAFVDGAPEGEVLGGWVVGEGWAEGRYFGVWSDVEAGVQIYDCWEGAVAFWERGAVEVGGQAEETGFVEDDDFSAWMFLADTLEGGADEVEGGWGGVDEDMLDGVGEEEGANNFGFARWGNITTLPLEWVFDKLDAILGDGRLEVGAADEVDGVSLLGQMGRRLDHTFAMSRSWKSCCNDDWLLSGCGSRCPVAGGYAACGFHCARFNCRLVLMRYCAATEYLLKVVCGKEKQADLWKGCRQDIYTRQGSSRPAHCRGSSAST